MQLQIVKIQHVTIDPGILLLNYSCSEAIMFPCVQYSKTGQSCIVAFVFYLYIHRKILKSFKRLMVLGSVECDVTSCRGQALIPVTKLMP